MKHLLPLLALLLAVALFPFTGRAQVTTASMEGVVTDIGAVPLVAATVIAVHEPSGTQYGTTTRGDGRYNLPNLRVGGPYTVTATYVGYETQTVENVSLSLAQKLNLDFGLRNASIELEEIVVSGRLDPELNNKRTGAATNVSTEQLQRLPTISRSASDYTRLTPASNGNSFAGRNDQYNNFSLDGSIFNNPFGLDAATPGGQTDAQPISLDAIEQIFTLAKA